ncbi:MAG: MlaA family lipoprotein, partial [SAR324 cluster bacterium]|nr:MlaA family lipoprotein [SAR324 cluster bacterium]
LTDPTSSKFAVRKENGDHVLYGNSELAPVGAKVVEVINDTSLHIGEYENLKKDAVDLYPFLREVYEQNRNRKIAE